MSIWVYQNQLGQGWSSKLGCIDFGCFGTCSETWTNSPLLAWNKNSSPSWFQPFSFPKDTSHIFPLEGLQGFSPFSGNMWDPFNVQPNCSILQVLTQDGSVKDMTSSSASGQPPARSPKFTSFPLLGPENLGGCYGVFIYALLISQLPTDETSQQHVNLKEAK